MLRPGCGNQKSLVLLRGIATCLPGRMQLWQPLVERVVSVDEFNCGLDALEIEIKLQAGQKVAASTKSRTHLGARHVQAGRMGVVHAPTTREWHEGPPAGYHAFFPTNILIHAACFVLAPLFAITF